MAPKKVTSYKIIVKSALSGLGLQNIDGSFRPGHNGPWNDLDTPARVTAHWSIIFLEAYKLTQNKKFKKAAIKAGEYLLSEECWPHKFSFFCRRKESKKNFCNGLIGQAWVIEALIKFGEELKELKFLQVAEEVILKHDFNEKKGLWYNLEIDGRRLNLNRTLNQQIWFAALAYRLGKITNSQVILNRIAIFLKKLPKNLHFNGRYIAHLVHPLSNFVYKEEAKGYLSFTLAGLAHLYNLNHSIIERGIIQKIQKSIDFLNKKLFSTKNKYCWSYNPTGIETAYVLNSFPELISIKSGKEWLGEQLKRHFNFQTNLMNIDTPDPEILCARIYELTYLPNLTLELHKD